MATKALPSPSTDDPRTPLLPLSEPTIHSPRFPIKSLLTNKYLHIISGPLACMLIFFFVELDGPRSSRNMLAALSWVFLWWLTEAVPMPITSMSPLFLFPIFGISSADSVAKAYMDDVIALVLGSFILALAIEHYNIHRRLALNVSSLDSTFKHHFFFFFPCLGYSLTYKCE